MWFLKINGKMACEAKEVKTMWHIACAHRNAGLATRDGRVVLVQHPNAKIEILQLDECPAMRRTEGAVK